MKRTKRVFAIIIGLTCLLVGSVAMAASINVTSDPGALGAEGGSVQLSISIANDSEYAMENIHLTHIFRQKQHIRFQQWHPIL